MKVIRELILFGIVGVIGFFADTGVLYLLKSTLGLYYARIISFITAVAVTWILNRNITFKQRVSSLSLSREFSHYFGMMLGGGFVNYLTYALLVYFFEHVAHEPIWGVAAGSLAGMAVNFLLARFFIFRSSDPLH
jgi:putative flippase GtrA